MKEFVKQIEIAFRHIIVYPLFRLILRNPIRNGRIDLKSVRKLLILRDDGIGDMIVSTPMFRTLKEANPSMKLAVFASPRNVEVIRHNPFLDDIFIVHGNVRDLWKELRRARSEHFDVVVNFVFNRTTTEGLVANFVAPKGLKVGQGLDKYQIYFNRLLKLERSEKHMVEVLANVVDEIFGTDFEHAPLSSEVFVNDDATIRVDSFLGKAGLHRRSVDSWRESYAVLNFSAVDVVRRMSVKQAAEIVKTIRSLQSERIVLIYPPSERPKLDHILSLIPQTDALVFPESGMASLLELASLIEGARYVVTCDTSIVHFAAAAKTPVFVLFTPTAAKNHEWKPYGVFNKCLYAKQGDGVDSIPLDLIKKELGEFVAHLRPPRSRVTQTTET